MNTNYARTDLACESAPKEAQYGGIDGVTVKVEDCDGTEMIITEVTNKNGEKVTNRKTGKYLTLCVGKVWMYADEDVDRIKELLSDKIHSLIIQCIGKEPSRVLVAGLGNRFITSDALGPLTIDKMIATRHMKQADRRVFDAIGKCELSLLAPGVIGQTGIEASDIIADMAKNVDAECIVVIDALAARSTDRLSGTIQLSDSGIHPGAGVGNNRKEISKKSMGIPVVSVGVPTVVDSATLVYDALERANIDKMPEGLNNVLSNGRSFFVSPKESDVIVSSMSDLLASSITSAVGNY